MPRGEPLWASRPDMNAMGLFIFAWNNPVKACAARFHDRDGARRGGARCGVNDNGAHRLLWRRPPQGGAAIRGGPGVLVDALSKGNGGPVTIWRQVELKVGRVGHGGLLWFKKKGFAGEPRCPYGGVMLVLGLDTALQRCSVAIIRGDEVLADESVGMERGHAERLAPMAAAALAKAGVSISDLSRVGVVVGPGGFTGVRVALSFARGLGVGTGIPIVGVTSLAALAAPDWEEGLVAPVIDARRGQVYAALYGQGGEIIMSPFVSEPKEVLQKLEDKAAGRKVRVLGSGAGLVVVGPAGWSVSEESQQIDARIVARLAANAPSPDGPPPPLYLRAPDAKPGKPGLFDSAVL